MFLHFAFVDKRKALSAVIFTAINTMLKQKHFHLILNASLH